MPESRAPQLENEFRCPGLLGRDYLVFRAEVMPPTSTPNPTRDISGRMLPDWGRASPSLSCLLLSLFAAAESCCAAGSCWNATPSRRGPWPEADGLLGCAGRVEGCFAATVNCTCVRLPLIGVPLASTNSTLTVCVPGVSPLNV